MRPPIARSARTEDDNGTGCACGEDSAILAQDDGGDRRAAAGGRLRQALRLAGVDYHRDNLSPTPNSSKMIGEGVPPL